VGAGVAMRESLRGGEGGRAMHKCAGCAGRDEKIESCACNEHDDKKGAQFVNGSGGVRGGVRVWRARRGGGTRGIHKEEKGKKPFLKVWGVCGCARLGGVRGGRLIKK